MAASATRRNITSSALPARKPDPAHCADQPAADTVLHRREGARPAKVVLTTMIDALALSAIPESAHALGPALRAFVSRLRHSALCWALW